jgi:hypothetical protein
MNFEERFNNFIVGNMISFTGNEARTGNLITVNLVVQQKTIQQEFNGENMVPVTRYIFTNRAIWHVGMNGLSIPQRWRSAEYPPSQDMQPGYRTLHLPAASPLILTNVNLVQGGGSIDDNKEKYLKYKAKYLELKNKLKN